MSLLKLDAQDAAAERPLHKAADYAAVVLAAGYSSRMGAFKPLLPMGGGTVIDCVLSQLRAAGIVRIIVVTGHRREALSSHLQDDVTAVFNPHYDAGMFSSVQAGLAAAGRYGRGVFLVPVDCPAFGEATVRKMIRCEEGRFAVPVYGGKKGHPLYIPADRVEEILAYQGSGGLKAVTDRYVEEMQRIPVDCEGVVLDMDTPSAYREVLEFLNHGSGPALSALAEGHRFFLVRHGQTRQHHEKIFLGQTDVPLSDLGRQQAKAAAVRLQQMGADVPCIYASPLCRARQTAEIIAGVMGRGAPLPVIEEEAWKEMRLGRWDGRPIREIQRDFPQAYARRGNDLFAFKIGSSMENFYDLQYRVVKALRRLLQSSPPGDLVIVAHKGVLRAVENNLADRGVEDAWTPMAAGAVRMVSMRSRDAK